MKRLVSGFSGVYTSQMRKTDKPPVYLLLSGGIDSAACARFYLTLGYKLRAIHVNYGQPAMSAEQRSAVALADYFRVAIHSVALSGIEITPSGEIPGRNSALLSAALMVSGSTPALISIGIHSGTRYFDCQESFVRLWDSLLSGYTDGRVQLGVPFLSWTKDAIWRYCSENTVPVGLTWSCEASSTAPCGMCSSCKDKERLLARA